MKLEYLSKGSADCPLIRLYDFGIKEAKKLHHIVSGLARGEIKSVKLQDLSFIESIQGCSLDLYINVNNDGIMNKRELYFECRLTQSGWKTIVNLIEPFVNDLKCYQWLDERGPVSLIFSPTGQW